MSKRSKQQSKIAGSSPSSREIRVSQQPHSKEVRTKENPDSTDQLTPAWQFHRCDQEHKLWGWKKLTHEEFIVIIKESIRSSQIIVRQVDTSNLIEISYPNLR